MKLYEHQIEALESTKEFNRVAYYYDMGLGKTFIGSEKMHQLNRLVNLVVCQKSKIDDWVQHFSNNYDMKVYDLTTPKVLSEFMGVASSERFYCVGIINYELAWRRKELLDLKNYTLMLDESSLIQNSKAKQTKFILKLNPDNCILLSGTPCSGKYENLWSQCKLLGWNISEKLFNEHYVNYVLMNLGGMTFKTVDRKNPYKNVERLKSKLAENGAVFKLTSECFELPEQIYTTVEVPVTKEYKKFIKDSIITVDGVELIGDTTLTKMLYARQLCGQYNINKLDAVRDLIESTNDRIIIFYNFNAEVNELVAMLDDMKRPYSMVNGSFKDLTAYETEDNSVTLCQYKAASKGLNLQLANKIIYFTPTTECENWMQSQKRTHRIGQERTCFYYMITCKDSIEERVYSALKRGTDYTNDLFRGDYEC